MSAAVTIPRNAPCKVCDGTGTLVRNGITTETCTFCEDGKPRFWCAVCGHQLPLCPCFGANRVLR